MKSSNEQTPRRFLHRGGALLAAAVLLVLAVGVAAAVSQTTARSTDMPGPADGTSSMHAWSGDDGPTTGWGQGRRDDRSWMWDHMDGGAWMRHHDGRWQRLRDHPGQWSWMFGHRDDMARLHARWAEGDRSTGTPNGRGPGCW